MQPNACAIKKVKDDMTGAPSNSSDNPTKESPPRRRNNDLPPEVMAIIWPALQVGGMSGLAGFVAGGFGGVLRSAPTTLFALASGIQWFTLGTTFMAARGTVYHIWGTENITTDDKIKASAIAGAASGTVGGMLRNLLLASSSKLSSPSRLFDVKPKPSGGRNVLPGAIMFAIFGASGQYLYNRLDAQHSLPKPEKKNSWLDSKWSPVKVLTDQEYKKMIEEKLLGVETDLALVDESIAALREKERELAEKKKDEGNEKK